MSDVCISTTEQEKPGGHISKIQFNNGEIVNIRKNDIVIFVGPNNSGKSQSLKDIFNLCQQKVAGVVISDITIIKKKALLTPLLDSIARPIKHGSFKRYSVMGSEVSVSEIIEKNFPESSVYGDFKSLFVAYLDTSARLTICKAPQSIQLDAPKHHPIHYAAFESKYRKWLSENFNKAFGEDLIPNTQFGASIPLCIGERVKLEGAFPDEQERLELYARILAKYKQVQNQGDGIRSFTGILLYLMLDHYCTFLIDEPESFLHPPQANIMGRIIGETLTDQQQAIISTHSEDIIKGLLSTCPERIKIIRITRERDVNSFSVLDNDRFSEVWNDPLLKYSNIMTSLFHKSVVLCESDSDCKMYSIIEEHLKRSRGKYSETLFIHCGGKHRMAKIINALKALNIDVKLISDIDVLNDESVFRGIVEAFGIEWDSIFKDYNIFVSNIHSPKEKIKREELRTRVDQILSKSSNPELTDTELKEIGEALRTISKWAPLKACGIAAIPSGDSTKAFGRMNQVLKENGIFIVPVGELECFIKEVGGHGPEWTNKVLETYPDLTDSVYDDIKNFIQDMSL
jgi:hypothetical protein